MAKRHHRATRAERRRQEQEYRKAKTQRTMKMMVPIAVIIVIVIVAAIVLLNSDQGPEDAEGIFVNSNNELEIEVSDVSENARFYKFDSNGVEVRFFAVRGNDGDIHVAMDACDACYNFKKGYRQAGDSMKCNNCGNEYATDGIGTKNLEGGCWPSYVPIKVQGGKILIKADDLADKEFMFR